MIATEELTQNFVYLSDHACTQKPKSAVAQMHLLEIYYAKFQQSRSGNIEM
jgi:hypothetical protein